MTAIIVYLSPFVALSLQLTTLSVPGIPVHMYFISTEQQVGHEAPSYLT